MQTIQTGIRNTVKPQPKQKLKQTQRPSQIIRYLQVNSFDLEKEIVELVSENPLAEVEYFSPTSGTEGDLSLIADRKESAYLVFLQNGNFSEKEEKILMVLLANCSPSGYLAKSDAGMSLLSETG